MGLLRKDKNIPLKTHKPYCCKKSILYLTIIFRSLTQLQTKAEKWINCFFLNNRIHRFCERLLTNAYKIKNTALLGLHTLFFLFLFFNVEWSKNPEKICKINHLQFCLFQFSDGSRDKRYRYYTS